MFTHPFIRMDKPGPKAIGIFWCEPCCREHEPEFYRNQKDDENCVERDLKEMFYGKSSP